MQDTHGLHMSARSRRLSGERYVGEKKKYTIQRTNEGRRRSESYNNRKLHTLVKGRSSSVMRNKREDVWCILGE